MTELIDLGIEFLETRSAYGSDSGLCLACIDEHFGRTRLVAFGLVAKQTVLRKSEAYQLAESAGVHLSEHGGTGQGVVGALAGIGLRLTGNDGRFRGWLEFDAPGSCKKVSGLCAPSEYRYGLQPG